MTHHLKVVPDHEHTWEAYTLTDEYGIFYHGHRCTECGAAGYALPMKSPSGGLMIEKINLVDDEYIAHLDEEHESDERGKDRH